MDAPVTLKLRAVDHYSFCSPIYTKDQGLRPGLFVPVIVRCLAHYLSDVYLYYPGASRRFSWTVPQKKREITHFRAQAFARILFAVW